MTAEIVVHAGGYVGVTAAIHYARAAKIVLVYDPDPSVVDGINRGEPKVGERLGYLGGGSGRERLRATTDFESVKDVPVHVVCVPSERDGKPWMDTVRQVIQRIGAANPSSLIIVESTLTPGTLGEFSEWPARGLHIAHAPRRDWFADAEMNLGTLTRVVGGLTPECTKRAVDVIASVTPRNLILETDARTAELVKPLENAFLHLPVMLACEVAQAYPDLDVAEALALACTHWRLMKVYLNAGTGGRCVQLGSQYVREGASRPMRVLASALEGEQRMRESVAAAIARRVGAGSSVLVLGIAYRPGLRDAGNSPGLGVARALERMGLRPSVCDPLWGPEDLAELCRLPVSEPSIRSFDAVFLATPHEPFKNPRDLGGWRSGHFVLDALGAWVEHREHFAELGVAYTRIGDPGWLG